MRTSIRGQIGYSLAQLLVSMVAASLFMMVFASLMVMQSRERRAIGEGLAAMDLQKLLRRARPLRPSVRRCLLQAKIPFRSRGLTERGTLSRRTSKRISIIRKPSSPSDRSQSESRCKQPMPEPTKPWLAAVDRAHSPLADVNSMSSRARAIISVSRPVGEPPSIKEQPLAARTAQHQQRSFPVRTL